MSWQLTSLSEPLQYPNDYEDDEHDDPCLENKRKQGTGDVDQHPHEAEANEGDDANDEPAENGGDVEVHNGEELVAEDKGDGGRLCE